MLADSAYEYTWRTIAAFCRAGAMPEMVRIGNETRTGMLWRASCQIDGAISRGS